MSKRIDHVAEADKCIRRARQREIDANTEAVISMAQAQVHATLALVEQQRIANLLRSGAIGGGPMNDHTPGWVQPYLRKEWPDIAAALGVGR